MGLWRWGVSLLRPYNTDAEVEMGFTSDSPLSLFLSLSDSHKPFSPSLGSVARLSLPGS